MADIKGTMPCGCTVALDTDKSITVIYCPKHGACDDMYTALEQAYQWLVRQSRSPRDEYDKMAGSLISALVKAKGGYKGLY